MTPDATVEIAEHRLATCRASRSPTTTWSALVGPAARRTSWRASRSDSATGWSTPQTGEHTREQLRDGRRRRRSRRSSARRRRREVDLLGPLHRQPGLPAAAAGHVRPGRARPRALRDARGPSGCAGAVEALDVARLYIERGPYRTAVVIGSETISPLLVPVFPAGPGRDPHARPHGPLQLRRRRGRDRPAGRRRRRAAASSARAIGLRRRRHEAGHADRRRAARTRRSTSSCRPSALVDLKVDVVEFGTLHAVRAHRGAGRDAAAAAACAPRTIDVCMIPEGNAGYMTDELEGGRAAHARVGGARGQDRREPRAGRRHRLRRRAAGARPRLEDGRGQAGRPGDAARDRDQQVEVRRHGPAVDGGGMTRRVPVSRARARSASAWARRCARPTPFCSTATSVSRMTSPACPSGGFASKGPIDELTRTEVSQPALFALSLALTECARQEGCEPAFVAGHSLGEYAAAVAAGALSLEDGMRLVVARSRLMAAVQAERPWCDGGGARPRRRPRCRSSATASGRRRRGQPQRARPDRRLRRVRRRADAVRPGRELRRARGAAAGRRGVPQPGDDAGARDPGATPPTSCAGGPPACRWPRTRRAGWCARRTTSAPRLVAQVAAPVLWVDCMRALVDAGATTFLELGPGRVLSGLVRSIRRELPATAADSRAPSSPRSRPRT